jgi:transcriptional regulator with XRE-family HTH domain
MPSRWRQELIPVMSMVKPRVCAACSTPLSAYNKGVLCNPCEREAFNAPYSTQQGIPVWLWATAPMRRMLASLRLGAAMETFRLAADMSQEEAGRITGWSGAGICQIETGKRDTIYDIRNLLRIVDAFKVPREMLLPVILGHPAVFTDRRIAYAEAGLNAKTGQSTMGYRPGEIMFIVSGKLKARGFEVTERVSGDEITEITVTNPEDRSTGTVNVGYDGYVTWEWLTDLKDRSEPDRITERISGLLSGNPEAETSMRLVSGG